MSTTNLIHTSPAKAMAALLLFVATGPEAVWLGLQVVVPVVDPGASRSVAALIVSPDATDRWQLSDFFVPLC